MRFICYKCNINKAYIVDVTTNMISWIQLFSQLHSQSTFPLFDSNLLYFVPSTKSESHQKKVKQNSLQWKMKMNCTWFWLCWIDFATWIIKLHTTKAATEYVTHVSPIYKLLLHPLNSFPGDPSLQRTEQSTL